MGVCCVQATLATYRLRQPLKTPYRLSFATIEAFDTLIVAIKGGERIGCGEITPLPGYSAETIESALAAMGRAGRALADGAPWSTAIADLALSDPMTASGLACARETWEEGVEAAFGAPVERPIPLAALCGGDTPGAAAERATELAGQGYRQLKLKVGTADIAADIARLAAVDEALPEGVTLTVDANQRLEPASAAALCDAAAGTAVILIEQPFPPTAREAFAALAKCSPVPLMLDESIWTAADIDEAAELGAAWVKLKLCKHPGTAANRALIRQARALGLGVIYGNGVQGALGNHLEARVYAAEALDTPAELNGVLKLESDAFGGGFHASGGMLEIKGIPDLTRTLDRLKPVLHHTIALL